MKHSHVAGLVGVSAWLALYNVASAQSCSTSGGIYACTYSGTSTASNFQYGSPDTLPMTVTTSGNVVMNVDPGSATGLNFGAIGNTSSSGEGGGVTGLQFTNTGSITLNPGTADSTQPTYGLQGSLQAGSGNPGGASYTHGFGGVTLNNSGAINLDLANFEVGPAAGIWASENGGNDTGGSGGGWTTGINLTNSGAINVTLTGQGSVAGILATTTGGNGVSNGTSTKDGSANGAGGGTGPINIWNSASVAVDFTWQDNGSADTGRFGIRAVATGGNGGGTTSDNLGSKTVGGVGGHADTPTINLDTGGNVSLAVNGAGPTLSKSLANLSGGVVAMSVGGAGGVGGDSQDGYDGGVGGNSTGASVVVQGATITTSGNVLPGIVAAAIGGNGGNGGLFNAGGTEHAHAGSGATGGGVSNGVTVSVSGPSPTTPTISTSGSNSPAIYAAAVGGNGGQGGTFSDGLGEGTAGYGGTGGWANGNGLSGNNTIAVSATNGILVTSGSNSPGIVARTQGGDGQDGLGGNATGAVYGGNGGDGGGAGNVSITLGGAGTISTTGSDSAGIIGQSFGGEAGNGGLGSGAAGNGGQGGAGGNTGLVRADIYGTIITTGPIARGVIVQSISGTGGSGGGGEGVYHTAGGNGASGGNTNQAIVNNNGSITTSGANAEGVLIQSIGGGGGAGGGASGLIYTVGGKGALAGDAYNATYNASGGTVTTSGIGAIGVLGQSIGGGGGDGGGSSGFGVTVGGTAGGGGSGATATANLNAGSVIATSGFGSIGMLMQSIGGGGGNASNAAGGGLFASVTVGGTGGSGGNAGTVQVTATDATVATQGAISPGIVAQSIGGGGGAGGSAFSGSVGAGFSVSAAVGGSGGNGGTGGAASVNVIGGSVKTGQSPLMQGTGPGVAGGCTALPCNQLPADNFGVVVQSIGGGGGIAGNATAEAMAIGVPTEDSVSVTATFTLGGSGGSGQDGGTAAFGLSNGGSIETAGQGSTGVVVQSIGGGGGQGGDSTSNSAAVGYGKNAIPGGSGWGMTGTIEVGGSGGSAGNGGNVVLAMGGTASASASSTTADTGSSVGTTSITTYGDHSTAIVAQSIGGGGGNAGWGAGNTQSFGEPTTASLTVGLGARGGLGGVGGTVTANLYSGSIVTWGSSSHGLLAQSVSGGGGTSVGGSFNIVQSFSKANSPITVKPGFNMTLGGEGVPGQDGGQVNATIGASIITKGGNAVGVLAQSIAGGGGVGGSAGADGSADNPIIPSKAIDTTMDALKAREAGSELGALIPDMNNSGSLPSIDPTFGLAIGGTGGQGGDGGQVTVNQNGPITTYGDWSHGILAQSVGGGGGMGGTGAATGTGGIPELTVNVTHAIGGRGGATGSGGPVNIAFGGATPAVTTMGFGAAGVVGQSIGGGGGAGADGSDQATGIISIGAGTASGANGAGGSGQAVSFTTSNSGAAAIATSGDAADGVVLQSIGGGGGLGGAGSSQYQQSWTSASNGSLTLQVGGASSANGTGGNVTFDSTGGPLSISTTGNYAYGILAQSIGGGGGAVSAIATTPNITTQIGGTSSVGGANAGNVNVTLANNSTISTAGYSAFGIMAQSIGGGGGLIRVIGDTSTPPQLDTGSSGSTQQSQPAVGGGGNVSVTVDPTSSVTASGYGAYGIFAQSINGGGGFIANGDVMYAGAPQQDFCADQPGGECAESAESSTVSVDVQGTVSALGSNAGAIFAQAAGYASGDAKISVSGTVQGNTTTNEAGNNTTQTALIQMDTPDGSNLLTVTPGGHVTASSIDGVFGNAVQSLSGMGTVELEGVLTGSLLLRDGKFNVHPGGVHNSGSTTQAGQVVNAGTINVGVPLSSVSSTLVDTVTGDYTQTSQGVLGVTVDSLRTAAGRMNVNGTANMDGVISPSAISLLPGEFTVLTAGTLQGSADAVDSLVIDWGARRSGNQISLTPNANYKPAGVKLTDSQTSLANYMNREWSSANPGAAYRNAGFSRITDAKSYTKALNSVSAKATQAQSIALANSSWTILGSSMSCPVFVASNTLMGEGNCVWGKIDGRWSDQSASGDTQAYDVSSTTYRFGGQHQIAPEWYLGGSLAVGQTWAHMNGGSSGDGDVYDGSITLKHIVGPWQFAGSVAVANGNFDVSRHVDVAGDVATLRGDPSVTMVGARIRVGYEFAHEDWYVKPYGDVDLVYTNMPGFNESGDSNYALNVRGSQQTNVAFTPMLEFGRRMNLDPKTTLRAYAAFGASIRPSAGYTVRSSFTNGLSSDGTFTDHVSAPDVLGKVDMGLQIYRANGFEVKAGYTVDFGSHYVSQTASARFAYHF